MFSSLCHENIVRVFEVPPDIKVFFSSQSVPKLPIEAPILCMEFCDNGSLRSILNRTENIRGMSENECLTILEIILSILDTYCGYNILVERKWTMKKMDIYFYSNQTYNFPGTHLGSFTAGRVLIFLILP